MIDLLFPSARFPCSNEPVKKISIFYEEFKGEIWMAKIPTLNPTKSIPKFPPTMVEWNVESH